MAKLQRPQLDKKRASHLHIRIDQESKETLVAAASKVGESISQFVEKSAKRRADDVMGVKS